MSKLDDVSFFVGDETFNVNGTLLVDGVHEPKLRLRVESGLHRYTSIDLTPKQVGALFTCIRDTIRKIEAFEEEGKK